MKKSFFNTFAIVLFALIISGCAPQTKGKGGADAGTLKNGTAADGTTTGNGNGNGNGISSMTDSDVEDIHFDYNRASLKSGARAILDNNAAILKATGSTVTIEGHCDERGTNEYNIALGQRRADAVKKYLRNKGVPSRQIMTVSYGEEKPLCQYSNESCWQKNRRAHFNVR